MAHEDDQRPKAVDRRGYRLEDLPDDIAEMAGLDELRDGVPEDGDNLIG
jgi:hypothetical protein